ncbi:MAG TPA: phosphoribosylformylglycinamidine synthase subunit PurL [Candidatus Brocadiia bacterium]|nr:phosphoribosylformylglycinamidine synthase subunit PurL [Candidatus Brocadiia bacterium]
MFYRIEVWPKPGQPDIVARDVLSDARHLGMTGLQEASYATVYILEGRLAPEQLGRICVELFCDPVVENFAAAVLTPNGRKPVRGLPGMFPGPDKPGGSVHVVEVSRKPGVMDPVQASALKGLSDIKINSVRSVKTARKYVLNGELSKSDATFIATRLLGNATIEDCHVDVAEVPYDIRIGKYAFRIQKVPVRKADDAELLRISKTGQLSLNLEEMRTVRAFFAKARRDPTDLELEILAQTWSEHCVHKTLRGQIEFNGRPIDNLLASTIAAATRRLNKPWCVSVFEDNAGVIRFDENFDICFKVETHNHPSAIEPYGGANTGIGGVIRDPLGTGLGAKPIMNTDIFCFGNPEMPLDKTPRGALHPRRVMKGVVAGVRDYGNRMGIPTTNGAVFFDDRYTGNPLVYCGNIGLIPRDKTRKEPHAGDLVLVIGGRTGRDGIHGATFSSVELTHQSEVTSGSAVQIGNAITEKKMVDTILKARDEGLYTCITDCGAGGLSSAVGEMGERLGAECDIEKVPLKYEGLAYWEIWISEAQERMVLAVPPANAERILKVFTDENVDATFIGRFTGDGRLALRYKGRVVCDLPMDFVHNGLPRLKREARWTPPVFADPLLESIAAGKSSKSPVGKAKGDYGDDLRAILSSPNVCSKEWIIRQYDHEVQGGSVLKPLVGIDNDGPGDASICAPVPGSTRGFIISCGLNPKYGDIDPYHSAASAIDEAIRNLIAVGGSLDQVALLDNFCWGNTNKPEQLGSLVLAAQACYDYAVVFGTPFISGKDSLNNEFNTGKEVIAIPPTLLISAIGIMPNVKMAVSMDAKTPGDLIYIVGMTYPELGGSHYYYTRGLTGMTVPRVRGFQARDIFAAMSVATSSALVRACHDCSEGGLAVAIAESCFAGGVGAEIDLRKVPFNDEGQAGWRRDDVLLFSESNSRFVVEVAPDKAEDFEKAMGEVPSARIGRLTVDNRLRVIGLKGGAVVEENLADLKEAWQRTLKW